MLADVKSELQASDTELHLGLKERHILVLKGELRPMSLAYLNTVLELLLNTLVSNSFSAEEAPASDVADNLEHDHEVPRSISEQVMAWFGELSSGSALGPDVKWKVDIKGIVKQIGIGLLSNYRVCTDSTPVESLTNYLANTERAY